MKRQARLSISFGGIGLHFMEDCAPFAFVGNWVLVAPYLCSRFCIFNKPILEEYVCQVEGGPHLFQSCLRVARDGLPLTIKHKHLSFESLVVAGALSLQTFLMDIHHDTLFRFILQDDSISSTSRICICSCSGKGARLWLVVRSSICLFHIVNSTFTSALCFCLGLIQPLTSSLFTCECEHELDASSMHLARCPFGG